MKYERVAVLTSFYRANSTFQISSSLTVKGGGCPAHPPSWEEDSIFHSVPDSNERRVLQYQTEYSTTVSQTLSTHHDLPSLLVQAVFW